MPEKINQELTDYLNNELVPILKESAHKYFGENFLDDFPWKNNKSKKNFSLREYYVSKSEFDGAFIDTDLNLELEANLFQNKKITGKGVFSFFHEVSHCWLNYKFEGDFNTFQNSGNRIQYNIAEGFCDFIACDVIKKTKIRHLFPDSLKYLEQLENAYSYLVNKIKYGSALEMRDCLEHELSEISTESLFGYEDKESLWWSNRPIRAKFFGIFSHCNTLKQKINFLPNPPRTMKELNNYIPKIPN